MSGWGISVSGFAEVTETLNGLSVDMTGDTAYIAGPTVEYAVEQEMGTSAIEARPFVRPAAEKVRNNLDSEIPRISKSQNIPLNSEAAIVRVAALAVQDRIKEIADRKDIRDTGQLINSVRIAEVS